MQPNDLVEGLATFLAARFPILKWQAVASAEAAIAGPLAPFLAAHQQVTAERDEARAEYERGLQHRNDLYDTVLSLRTSLAAAKSREDTATSELARLRAEGEAKDRALKEIAEHPENYDDGQRSYAVGWAFWNIQNIARTALARAATAREG